MQNCDSSKNDEITDGKLKIGLKDISNCVKFRAFVHETLRIANAVPTIPRVLTQDCLLSFDS